MHKNGVANIDPKRSIVLLIIAFAAVYILWGSTYLAIKYVIETLPSFISTGTRFLLAGSTLFIIGRFSKDYEKPTLRQWRASFVVGVLLFLCGRSEEHTSELQSLR